MTAGRPDESSKIQVQSRHRAGWRGGAHRSLIADINGLRLVVYPPLRLYGQFRFEVLRRQCGPGSPFALVKAGSHIELGCAITAAEQAAV